MKRIQIQIAQKSDSLENLRNAPIFYQFNNEKYNPKN